MVNTKAKILFNYYQNVESAYAEPGFVYADVPAGFRDMKELLEHYRGLKHITNWHAYNFASFLDGINSVEYYPASKNKIIHHDMPKLNTEALTVGYLDTLNMAVQYLNLHRMLKNQTKPPYGAELRVYFPEETKDIIGKLFVKYGVTDIETMVMNDDNLKQGIIHWAENTINSGEWKRWRKRVGLPEDPE